MGFDSNLCFLFGLALFVGISKVEFWMSRRVPLEAAVAVSAEISGFRSALHWGLLLGGLVGVFWFGGCLGTEFSAMISDATCIAGLGGPTGGLQDALLGRDGTVRGAGTGAVPTCSRKGRGGTVRGSQRLMMTTALALTTPLAFCVPDVRKDSKHEFNQFSCHKGLRKMITCCIASVCAVCSV